MNQSREITLTGDAVTSAGQFFPPGPSKPSSHLDADPYLFGFFTSEEFAEHRALSQGRHRLPQWHQRVGPVWASGGLTFDVREVGADVGEGIVVEPSRSTEAHRAGATARVAADAVLVEERFASTLVGRRIGRRTNRSDATGVIAATCAQQPREQKQFLHDAIFSTVPRKPQVTKSSVAAFITFYRKRDVRTD
jgi:hypothetical protein